MLYLNEPTKEILNIYYVKIKSSLEENINNSTLKVQFKNFLKANLEDIIKSKPQKLKALNDDFVKIFISPRENSFYKNYLKIISINEKRRTIQQKLIYNFFENKMSKIKNIFNYDKIISSSKSKSYWLAKTLNTNTCIYCNRLYANTIEIGDGSNDQKRISRPSFDHWFSKSRHPILALSYYNLIPSCTICNSVIKGSINFDLSSHIHPYIKDLNNSFVFSYEPISLTDFGITVRDYEKLSDKTKNTIKDFKILEVFNGHSNTELKDLLDLRYKYSKNYLDILLNKTFNDELSMSNDEVYRMIFGVEFNENEYHKRPFSKFKNDIISEIIGLKS